MKRYEKFVLEAEKGITFEVSEGTSGELIIRALNIATANVYSTNYVNPPIPEGYKHVCGEWNNGFSTLVFVPRFILSSTDHCKTILICFQTQIEGENFEISEFLLLFYIFFNRS